MNTHKLTCEEARKIPIIPILNKLGRSPKKRLGNQVWFTSFLRPSEKTPSLKVDTHINRWYDHGEGLGGNSIDLVMKFQKCSVAEALEFLNTESHFFSFQEQKIGNDNSQPKSLKKESYEILKIKNLENEALIDYLKSRSIDIEIAKKYCCEIYYRMNDKRFFSIAFENEKGGYELRNKYYKLCLGKKSITHTKNGSEKLTIFEGFIDFLSYLTLFKKVDLKNEDYLILNSVSLAKNIINDIQKYSLIHSYLDNDNAGTKATVLLKENHSNFLDCRFFFQQHKDLNEYLQKRSIHSKNKY